MTFSRRGQVEGTVIIYVLAIFIASLVLLFGYTVIKNLSESTRSIELLEFKQDLKNQVEQKLSEFRSRDTITLSLPSNFDEVCFSDGSLDSLTEAQSNSLTIVAHLLEEEPPTEYNVFLLENNIMRDAVSVGKLSFGQDIHFFCTEFIDGRVSLTFEALGRQGVNIIPRP